MYINTFKYTPRDVDCKFCTEYERGIGCTTHGCPWLNERIEAGIVCYADAVIGIFEEHPALYPRLRHLFRLWPGTLWTDGTHRLRMDWLTTYLGYSRKRDTPAFYAAMYLLTSNADIYNRTINCFGKQGFDHNCTKRRGISPHNYTLLMAARGIYDNMDAFLVADLVDPEIIDPEAFRLIVNAVLIARYGLAAFNLKRRTQMDLDTKHIQGDRLVAVERYKDSTRHMIEFTIISPQCPYGDSGCKMRLFLSEDGYVEALERQRSKQIKIRRHACVIEGNLIYDHKKNKTRRR